MAIEAVRVLGIFGRQDVTFDFIQSPFFIVGPNGTGKTTALKVLHGILTGSWSRLQTLPFNTAEVDIDGQTFNLAKSDFRKIMGIRELMVESTRRNRGRSLSLPPDWLTAQKIIEGEYGSSVRRARVPTYLIDSLPIFYETAARIINVVEAETLGKVLYFPTYRRVERDLHELLEDDEDPFSEEPTIAPKIADRFRSAGEVVGFGGQDIRALLDDTADRINGQARAALNQHSVKFLEAISKHKPEASQAARDIVTSKEQTDYLLARVERLSTAVPDIGLISESIDALRGRLSKRGRGRITTQQEMQLFYLGELIKLFIKIDELSSPLKKFSDLITKYFYPFKKLYLRESDNRVVIADQFENEIELYNLSSGEKQILAFFAFLFLNKFESVRYIIVDEPELSLSVSWQKSLIRDIVDSSPGTYVCCATHSPFIFDSFPLESVANLGDL